MITSMTKKGSYKVRGPPLVQPVALPAPLLFPSEFRTWVLTISSWPLSWGPWGWTVPVRVECWQVASGVLLNVSTSGSQGRLMCSICQFPRHQNSLGSHLEPLVWPHPGHKVPKTLSWLWCSVASNPPLLFVSAPASSAVIPVLRKALWMPLQRSLRTFLRISIIRDTGQTRWILNNILNKSNIRKRIRQELYALF